MGVIANKIRQAIYGVDVREDIAQGIEAVESLREEFDIQVISAGNSNSEIVAARCGETSLPVKIGKIDSSLVDIPKNVIPTNYTGAVVTFIDDDATLATINNWKVIADAKGIKINLAVITSKVGGSAVYGGYRFLTLTELKSLQSEGFEIVSHSETHPHLELISDAQLDAEMKNSLEWIKANGFGQLENAIVEPYGYFSAIDDLRIKNIIRKYYQYGINVNNKNNPSPIDNFHINRIHSDARDLVGLKSALDEAIINGSWVVVLSHCWDSAHWDSTKVSDFIDYIQSKNVPIMTVSDAVKIKGNAIAVGEYTSNSNAFISRDGKFLFGQKGKTVYSEDETSDMDRAITDYEALAITVQPFNTASDLAAGKGGSIVTFRQGVLKNSENYSSQIYFNYNSNLIKRRFWNNTTNAWSVWTTIYSVQENWITPTLLNGWINAVDQTPIQYMKDTMGFVHLKGCATGGTANTSIFELPAGYRLAAKYLIPTVQKDASYVMSSAALSIETSGKIYVNALSANTVSLNVAPFKAE